MGRIGGRPFIDKYGKFGVKLALTILMIINVALAILLIFICCCSMKACTSCCCFRCLFKFCTHIFWNVLALMMIITLLIGSLFSIIGKVGNDGMSLVSYIVSQENLNNEGKKLYKKLKIKFTFFFIISCFILLFFWYYITCFCSIYSNTQMHLIKDTITSFALSLIYPFGIYLFPTIFRILSLRDKKGKKEYLYKLSKIFQLL